MNIAHVIFCLRTGGAELMLLDIVKAQADDGNRVSLVVINDLVDDGLRAMIPPNVDVAFIGRPKGSVNPWWLIKYNRKLWSLKPDVIHFHDDKAAGMTWRLVKAKFVATVHDTGLRLNYFKGMNVVCSISRAVGTDIAERYGMTSEVIPNGIDTAAIKARRADLTTAGSVSIVQVSRLEHVKKGQDLLIEAAAKLIDQGYRITVDFIGDGNSREYLHQLVMKHGIGQSVKFLGNKPREYVYGHLCDYDLFVQPSRNEGFGLTIAEAMAAKVPVLTSDIEGPAEVVGRGKYGSMFKSGSADDLADKIAAMINDYCKYSRSAQAEVYERCVKEFDIRTTANRYLTVYQRTLKR